MQLQVTNKPANYSCQFGSGQKPWQHFWGSKLLVILAPYGSGTAALYNCNATWVRVRYDRLFIGVDQNWKNGITMVFSLIRFKPETIKQYFSYFVIRIKRRERIKPNLKKTVQFWFLQIRFFHFEPNKQRWRKRAGLAEVWKKILCNLLLQRTKHFANISDLELPIKITLTNWCDVHFSCYYYELSMN